MLAARAPATPSVARAPTTPSAAPAFSRLSAPPLLHTPSGGGALPRTHTHCGYCDMDGHPESDCFKKKRDMRNREHTSRETRASPTPSTVSLTEQDIVSLKRLLAASGSSTGTAGSVTGASSAERLPST
uniref:Uncharacterized protein n=1 Tax=Avena sativa TaxID=4498 RepID=A0ACD5VEA9_AVESA